MTSARGFTLVELLIALAIVGALLVTAFGGMRVVLGAAQRGEELTESHQHVRSMATVLGRAVGAAFPYKGAFGDTPEAKLLFRGEESRIQFVTQAPPYPLPIPVAFTAVVIERVDGEGLVVRERALPNREPFAAAPVVLRDPSVATLRFRYMDDGRTWQEKWEDEDTMPLAVEVSVAATLNGRAEVLPPVVVGLRVGTE